MKKILITGANSYIGTSFEKYLNKWKDKYQVDTVDMIDGSWRDKNFADYDTVFHVAGIAHSDSGRIQKDTEALYYRINTDLTIDTAYKAKKEGVRQFVFMSSIIVYGDSAPVGKQKIITSDTPTSPANCYGDSKLQAERGLALLQSDDFNIVILRPPMIYGKGCKGNYVALSNYAQKLPFFPYVENQRSMLYIENLCEFVRLMVENSEKGIFYPQNSEYVNTSELVRTIAGLHDKKVHLTKVCNPFLMLLSKKSSVIKKAFGSLSYDMKLGEYATDYRVVNFYESVKQSEVIR